jgi:hypothetical protein
MGAADGQRQSRPLLLDKGCLKREPLQIEAGVWGLIDKFPDTYALILQTRRASPKCQTRVCARFAIVARSPFTQPPIDWFTNMTSSHSHKQKLIEVALPLDAINRGCEEDKNRKTGHIRNLHKWFAPMPLPSWRAMLFAAIVDDPGDHADANGTCVAERARLLALVERLSAFGFRLL